MTSFKNYKEEETNNYLFKKKRSYIHIYGIPSIILSAEVDNLSGMRVSRPFYIAPPASSLETGKNAVEIPGSDLTFFF